ncbi:MAG: polyprenyl synthetase family protein [Pseudomonadota bacterium]
MTAFAARRSACADAVASCFETSLRDWGSEPVVDAMRYALDGGKRLRGFFVMESAALFGIADAASVHAAAAIEALHAYSLVHDDLPAMDDDDLRRGQPTVHMKWDEATAILVGDALQSLAFGLLARDELGSAEARVALVAALAKAAGGQGMVLGQAQDIAAESAARPLDLGQISELQRNKTGALIRWSCEAGAILGGADPEPLIRYSKALGLAFQIADDLLDVEGDVAATGKRVGKDADAGKATFVSLMGMEDAKTKAAELVEEACDALAPYGDKAAVMREAARFVITRES